MMLPGMRFIPRGYNRRVGMWVLSDLRCREEQYLAITINGEQEAWTIRGLGEKQFGEIWTAAKYGCP